MDGNKNSPCKGHALGEAAKWYDAVSWMVNTVYPWFIRGGSHEITGFFCFNGSGGSESSARSFRQVLTPNNN